MSKRVITSLLWLAALSSLTVCSATSGGGSGSWLSRWWHGPADLERPSYEILKEYDDGLQLRRYTPGAWAYTTINKSSFNMAAFEGFRRLFRYISGDNEEDERIPMTKPVGIQVTVVRGGDGPKDDNHEPVGLDDRFYVAFYLPRKYQRNPPISRSKDISISDRSEVEVYAKPFGGWAMGYRIRRLGLGLMDSLQDCFGKDEIVDDSFVVAVYDPPFKIFNRHNEIIVVRKSKKQ